MKTYFASNYCFLWFIKDFQGLFKKNLMYLKDTLGLSLKILEATGIPIQVSIYLEVTILTQVQETT